MEERDWRVREEAEAAQVLIKNAYVAQEFFDFYHLIRISILFVSSVIVIFESSV